MRSGTVAPAIVALAAALFAIVSLPRVRLEYTLDVAFPELGVDLRLPPAVNLDSAQTTRQWVLPIESALRAAGDTTGTRGEVNAGAATIVARFKRGTDIELKAARLASDLAPLRARLPRGASLDIFPARGGLRPNAAFAVTGPAAGDRAYRIAEELRSTAGVREVRTFGTTRAEIDVRLRTDAVVTPAEVIAALMPRPIAEVGPRRLPLLAIPTARDVRDVPAGPVRLGDVADIRLRREEPSSLARFNGGDAAVVSVYRDDDAPLLSFDRAVMRVVGNRGTPIWSDASELREILRWLLAGAIVAALLLLRRAPLYVPLALALMINVWRVASMRVDAQTLAMAAIAVAAIAPFVAARSVSRAVWPLAVAAAFIALLPVAAIFGSGALAPLLGPPSRDFAVAGACALAASLFVVPVPARPRAGVKRLLRKPASVVLACAAVTVLFLSWFGARLDPRRSQGSVDRSRVFVRMQLPSGATLGQTARAAHGLEDALRGLGGVKRYWTSVNPGTASVIIELQKRFQQPQAYDLFQIALRSRIPPTAGAVSIESSFDRTASSTYAESIEEQPYADESGRVYRFLLKGTDAEVLRRTAESLKTRIARGPVARSQIRSAWPEASARIELVPSPELPPAAADAAAAELARLTLPPPESELPNGTLLGVTARDAPRGEDDVPRLGDVFARPLRAGDRTIAVESAFAARRVSTEGSVTRELGRFVLPIEVDVRAPTLEQAIAKRKEIDRSVSLAPLPAGVVAERPQLAAWSFSAAKLRLAAMAAFLPLLLFVAAAIALSSLARACIALAPVATAVALVAPVLAAASAPLDEMTLLAAGAAACCVAAHAVVVLLAGRAYRTVQQRAAAIAIATIAGGALLLFAAAARPAIAGVWRAPLLAAATIVLAGVPASLLLPVAIDFLARDAQRRRGPAADVAVWRDDAVRPLLGVRNVTKIYPGGFRALHRVSFELSPGVIGLLGPNGAGKTTLLRILTGLLRPTRGTIAWKGVPVHAGLAEFRRAIGFLPQEFNAYDGLTAAQFLDFWALERGIESPGARRQQIESLLALVGLGEHANRRVRDFSGGMRQRIGIARALLGDPPLLVVDEPTSGIDIEARRRFRELITAIGRQRIVILSSHIASDIETTATRLLLLSRGELLWDGTVEGLLARAVGRVFEIVVSDAEVHALARQFRITARVRVPDGIRIRGVAAEEQDIPGGAVKPSLEEAYLAEMSKGVPRQSTFAFVFASS